MVKEPGQNLSANLAFFGISFANLSNCAIDLM
jgi:hypothetical protein